MGINTGYLRAKTNKQSDEYFTPAYAVKPLLKYLPRTATIWCPFDNENSEYVKIFDKNGYEVLYSHIDNGQNFFYWEPKHKYDIIISNPPFSVKDDVLKRLYELNKPYAMLLPIPTLQGQKRFQYIKDCEALIFDKRINFYLDNEGIKVTNNVSFGSFYLCKNILPEKLIFEELIVK